MRGGLTTLLAAAAGMFGFGCGSGSESGSGGGKERAATVPQATSATHPVYPRDIVAEPPHKTAHQALAAAQSSFPGNVRGIVLRRPPSGGLEYGVVLIDRTVAYDVKLGANSLRELSSRRVDLDDDDADSAQREIFDPADLVPVDEAAASARMRQRGKVVGWRLIGQESGRIRYEFRIIPIGTNKQVEVAIDARTGKPL